MKNILIVVSVFLASTSFAQTMQDMRESNEIFLRSENVAISDLQLEKGWTCESRHYYRPRETRKNYLVFQQVSDKDFNQSGGFQGESFSFDSSGNFVSNYKYPGWDYQYTSAIRKFEDKLIVETSIDGETSVKDMIPSSIGPAGFRVWHYLFCTVGE